MKPEEIIRELAETEWPTLPRKALEAAIAAPDDITPLLLEQLDAVATDIDMAGDEEANIALYACYLLAQFREARAYPLIVKLASGPEDAVSAVLGDTITESLGRFLASVCHGDTTLIKQLVENQQAYTYVRTAALGSLVVLYNEQAISKTAIHDYFANLFHLYPIREPSHVWEYLSLLSGFLGFTDLLPDIRKAYNEGLINPRFASMGTFENDMANPEESEKQLKIEGFYITDTIAELQKIQRRFTSIPEAKPGANFTPSYEPVIRDCSKTGRNDPCPCGSGRKFKKCCG